MSATSGERGGLVMANHTSQELNLGAIAQEIYTQGVLGLKSEYLKQGACLPGSYSDWRRTIMSYLFQVVLTVDPSAGVYGMGTAQKSVCRMLFEVRLARMPIRDRKAVLIRVLAFLVEELRVEADESRVDRSVKLDSACESTREYSPDELRRILQGANTAPF
jgi:hypothetical protein